MFSSRSDGSPAGARRFRSVLIWAAVLTTAIVPVIAAAMSPLLQWRQPVYIAAGFAGVIAMVFLLFQPLLASRFLPGVPSSYARTAHRWVGGGLVLAVSAHVAGLWITSPPDVIDVLLFRSPTPFSVWGVFAMWAVFAAVLLAVFRRRLQLRPKIWRRAHAFFAIVVVIGSVVHALLIEGTMEPVSKTVLCVFALVAAPMAIKVLNIWTFGLRRQP